MDYVPPLGTSPGTAYTNGDAAVGLEGSVPPAQAIEYPQREIVAAIAAAGLTPDANDLAQLTQAIRALVEAGRPSLIAEHRTTAAVNGGTLAAGAWRTRPLTVAPLNSLGANIAANRITLPAGTYDARGWQVVVGCNAAKARLRTAGGVTLLLGASMNSNNSGNGDTAGPAIPIEGRFVLAGPADVEMQVRSDETKADIGMGFALNDGDDNVYAMLRIDRVAS